MLKYAVIILSILIYLSSLSADSYISINPLQVSVAPGEQIPYVVGFVEDGEVKPVFPWDFKFKADNGSFSGNVYKAPQVPGTYLVFVGYEETEGIAIVNVIGREPVAKIMIPEDKIEIFTGDKYQFKVKVYGKTGQELFYQPAWMAKGGKIDGKGLFTAGNNPGQYSIVALGSDGIKATATVSVKEKKAVAEKLVITVEKTTIQVGESIPLNATGYDSGNNKVDTIIHWKSIAGNSNNSPFRFSAKQPGNYDITAVDTVSGKETKITLKVIPIPSILTRIEIVAEKNTLFLGEKIQLKVLGYDQYGKALEFLPIWQAEGGIIENGTYTAGNQVGKYTVVVGDKQTLLKQQMVFEIQEKPQSPKRIEIAVDRENITIGESLSFVAIVYDKEDNIMEMPILWETTKGIIDQDGNFTAEEAGEYTVSVRGVENNIVAHKTIKVLPPENNIAAVENNVATDKNPDWDWENKENDEFAIDETDNNDFIVDEMDDRNEFAIDETDSNDFTVDETGDRNEFAIDETDNNDFTVDETDDRNEFAIDETDNNDFTVDETDDRNEFAIDETDNNDFAVDETDNNDFAVGETNTNSQPSLVVNTIKISPDKITIQPDNSFQFKIEAFNENGDLVDVKVNWEATGGTIDANGLYKAGNNSGNFVVMASGEGVQAKAEVSIFQAFQEITRISRVEINPQNITIQPGETVQFAANAYDSNNVKVSVSVKWEATGGSISQNGRYTAGNTLGKYTVKAVYSEENMSAHARVSIAPKNDYELVVSPQDSKVKPGESVRFQVTLQKEGKEIWSWPWEYTFIASEGTFNELVYTAPKKPGAYAIEIRHPKASKNIVLIVIDEENSFESVAKIEVNRESLTLEPGARYTFTAKALDENGKAKDISLLWRANGGNIDNNGTFTAGPNPGNYVIEVLEPSSGVSKSINIEIATQNANSYRVVMAPSELKVQIGTKQKVNFKIYKGSFEEFSWPWEYKINAQAGSYADGVYTAPSEVGVYALEVVHGKAKATFAIHVIPPQIKSFTLNPHNKKVKEGQKVAFAAVAVDENGKKMDFSLEWSCTAGEIDKNGNYLAKESGNHTITAQIIGTDVKAETTISVVGKLKIFVSPHPLRVPIGESLRLTITVVKGKEKIWAWPWEFKCTSEKGSFHETLYKAPTEPGIYKVNIRYKKWLKRSKIEVYQPKSDSTKLKIEPENITLSPLQKHLFKANLYDSYGNQLSSKIEWQAEGGIIDKNGMYTAGAIIGKYKIVAVDQNSGTHSEVYISIIEPIERIVIKPGNKSLRPGEAFKFEALGIRRGAEVAVNVNWQATGGTITEDGLFTAGSNIGRNYVVRASTSNGLSTSVNVDITQASIVNIKIVPENVQLVPGEKVQFKAVGVDENENQIVLSPKWFAIGGVIDTNGVYTAGEKIGRYYVTVIDTKSHLFAKAPVLIERERNEYNSSGYSLNVSVSSRNVKPNENVVIKPTLIKNNSVEWAWPWEFKYKASAGILVGEYGNIWIAPKYSGTYTITISHKKATTQIYLKVTTSDGLDVNRIVVTPDKVTLKPRELYKFSAVAYKANGQRCACPIRWASTGGNIDQSGTYQAGSTTGTYEVKAYYQDIEQAVTITISQSESTYQLGKEWGRSLRASRVSRNQTRKFMYGNIFTKSEEELEQFRRGFVDGYGAAGIYLVQELLCNVASDFGKVYGHNLYWGNTTKTQLANFARIYIVRLPNSCHHAFKQGFLSGYKHYKGEQIYEQIYRWAKYRRQ